jgi:aspartate aminotransferase
MSVGQRARAIAESPTMKLNEEARLLRERGESVIHLGIGEPKNKTPRAAVESVAAKLAGGEIKYTPTGGIPSLKKAIVRYTEENYGRTVAPYNVIVTDGAKQAIFNALYGLLDPGQEVILLAPYWVSYPEMVKMLSGVPVVVAPADGSFHPRITEVERAVTDRTRAIIVNSPNNPSGVVFSEEFVGSLVDFCERRGIYAIMDDIYHKLVFDGCKAPSCYRFTTRDTDRSHLVVVNGVAKTYGMTGFRIGWAVGSRELVKVMGNVQSQTTSCSSVLTQVGAEGALTGPQAVVEELRLFIEHNRDVVMQELGELPGVKTSKPNGTFYCLPDFREFLGGSIARDSLELSSFLLSKARVVTVPGKAFGVEGHLRLSYAGPTEDVIEGIRRIRWALDSRTPREIAFGGKTYVRDWL